ncbi:MAG: hypothetical protein IJ767_06760 [Bacteroidaceae bacterium]|nr:hypothetical protein [Bacteroidaceae bacterium]
MKNLILTVLFLTSMSLSAQKQKDVTKFLGIPVDGLKSEMIQKLKTRGFTYEYKDGVEYMDGEFNGIDVYLFIQTNNNKVCRIMVSDKNKVDASDIRIRFNKLCQQFEQNGRYMHSYTESVWPLFVEDSLAYISSDENIDFQISVNKKRYQASFYQLLEEDIYKNREFLRNYISYFVSRWNNKYEKAEDKLVYDEALQEVLDYLDRKTAEDDTKALVAIILKSFFIEQVKNKSVWFMIYESYGKYGINLFYDNEYNKANGEDL